MFCSWGSYRLILIDGSESAIENLVTSSVLQVIIKSRNM